MQKLIYKKDFLKMKSQSIKHDLLEINLFSHLHDGNRILFCKTDFLSSIFSYISNLSHDIILITGNSDYEINDEIIAKSPSNIKHWFAQNANSTKIHGLPIGLENTIKCKINEHGVVWPHALPKHNLIHSAKDKLPSKNIYGNFSISTNPSIRKKVFDICQSNEHITSDICFNHQEINKRSYSNYINNILDHKMVVCPEGNGIDCHRVWETLLLGRVPIVRKSKVMNHFSDLPILYLDDWDELKDLKSLNQSYESIKDNSIEKLNFKYWKSFILSLKDKL